MSKPNVKDKHPFRNYLIVFVLSLVFVSLLSMYHETKVEPTPPKLRKQLFRKNCYTWHSNHRLKTRENNVLEFLAANNDTNYCHEGVNDEFFNVKHDNCQFCETKRSFWAQVRLIKREPRENYGKTICIASERYVRRYRCNLIKENNLSDEDYANCKNAFRVVYDVGNEAGFLCAVISPKTAIITQIQNAGRYHYA